MNRTFISFLGTNNYLECRYSLHENPGSVVKYVQEDIAARFCRQWGEDDKIQIFTTGEALEKNWDDNGHKDRKTGEIIPSSGLGSRLMAMKLQAAVKRHDIAVGNNEAEIWQIFQAVYDSLGHGDEIIFDITHGFRSIPMLFMTLIGYARMLKQISVKGIYYGAFEQLGPAYEVEKNIPVDERVAPIFDLTSFDKLIHWTEAIQSFVKNGSSREFAALAHGEVGPILKDTRGKDRVAGDIRDISKGMEVISRNLMLNRGARIIEFDYGRIKEKLTSLKDSDIFIRPLEPLLSVMETKIDAFARDDVENGFRAVEWCVTHGLYQQAVTMLQENMVTHILAGEGLDWGVERHRKAAGMALKLVSDSTSRLNEDGEDPSLVEFVKRLMENLVVKTFASDMESLGSIRNDVNHGGFLTETDKKARSSESILERFDRIRKSIFSKLETEEKLTPANDKKSSRMLLLLSHSLTSEQIADAKIAFKISEFMEMPDYVKAVWSQIPPDSPNLEEILDPVKAWLQKESSKGDIVVIQGDFGATFLMVGFAMENGLAPVYATTSRKFRESPGKNGIIKMEHLFRHRRFRHYGV
ncbi:MAG: TIGR02221 family CRISPR-associated protein [Desulfamplus sp.]|nr:TIGR02221 family CRISPR-associated protein [Desulfamplus sp.]